MSRRLKSPPEYSVEFNSLMKPNVHFSLSREATRKRLKNHIGEIVLRVFDPPEDCGFWLTPFNLFELEQWWRAQTRIPFHWNPTEETITIEKMLGLILSEKVDDDYRPFHVPGIFLYDGRKAWFRKMWDELRSAGCHYKCVLCCDTDSYLQRPDGSRILHKGSKLLQVRPATISSPR